MLAAVRALVQQPGSRRVSLLAWDRSPSAGHPPPCPGKAAISSFTRSLELTLLNFLKVAEGPTHTTYLFSFLKLPFSAHKQSEHCLVICVVASDN